VLAPVKVGAGTAFTSVTTGYDHSCAIAASGALHCWGSNEFGQLGDGTGVSALAGAGRATLENAHGAWPVVKRARGSNRGPESGTMRPCMGDANLVGERIHDRYRVIARLARGGMCEVYLALHGRTPVVIKRLNPVLRVDKDAARLFRDEAKITSSLRFPNIVEVRGISEEDGYPLLVMEYLPGATLVQLFEGMRTRAPAGFVVGVLRDVARALQHAHAHVGEGGVPDPVLHRDVSPKNVLVTEEGVTKLLDFGIAKRLLAPGRTSAGVVVGTLAYMSPEQLLGESLDPRSDVYSLGVTLYEMLTGKPPFETPNVIEQHRRAQTESPRAPSVFDRTLVRLDGIVFSALRGRRDERCASAAEFAGDLDKAFGDEMWSVQRRGEYVRKAVGEQVGRIRALIDDALLGGGGVPLGIEDDDVATRCDRAPRAAEELSGVHDVLEDLLFEDVAIDADGMVPLDPESGAGHHLEPASRVAQAAAAAAATAGAREAGRVQRNERAARARGGEQAQGRRATRGDGAGAHRQPRPDGRRPRARAAAAAERRAGARRRRDHRRDVAEEGARAISGRSACGGRRGPRTGRQARLARDGLRADLGRAGRGPRSPACRCAGYARRRASSTTAGCESPRRPRRRCSRPPRWRPPRSAAAA